MQTSMVTDINNILRLKKKLHKAINDFSTVSVVHLMTI